MYSSDYLEKSYFQYLMKAMLEDIFIEPFVYVSK